MRKNIYLITVLIAIVIIYMCFFRKETFANASVGDLVQDRVNPLVANTNFGTNIGVTDVGIPVAQANALREMSITGLNKPDQYHTLTGGITTTQGFADYHMSLPIFDENSMLAMDNFCKSYNVSTNPFGDPNSKFSKNCGVCFGDGTPKGVLLYEKDKELATVNQRARKYKYPRAMPSLGRSTCTGATSQIDDSAPPTLAINSEMYNDINGRKLCLQTKTFGNNCGQCVTNNSIWSYVKGDPGMNMNGLKLYLVGKGKVTVKVNNVLISDEDKVLPQNGLSILIGNYGTANTIIKEGDTISISVKQDGSNTAYIGGALEGTVATGGKYLRDLYDFVKDKTFGSSTSSPTTVLMSLLSSYTPNPSIRVKRIEVNPGVVRASSTAISAAIATQQSGTIDAAVAAAKAAVKIKLEGSIPLTFIDPAQNEMAFYDCKNGPYIKQQASADLLKVIDECAGQPSASGYTDECKRKKVLEAGCSSAGTWWRDPGQITQTTGLDAWLSSQKATARTVPAASMGCYGVDISTPCDSSPGSKECLAYTYASSQQ